MPTCWTCGQEIEFRTIDGERRPIHLHGYCDGRSQYSDEAIGTAVPARCPHCNQMAYFVRHNGGNVWMDALGPPWPRHKCSNWEPERRTAAKDTLASPEEIKAVVRRYEEHAEKVHKKEETSTQSPVVASKQQLPILNKSTSVTMPHSSDPPKTVRADIGTQPEGRAVLDEQGRRRCDFCSAMVRPRKYSRHLKKMHGNAEASDAGRQSQGLLKVHGLGGTEANLLDADFSKLPQRSVRVLEHDKLVTLQGALLSDVLARVLSPIGDEFLSTSASYYVIAEALHGNRAVFAWAELDSTFSDRRVYVINKQDGEPLSDGTGPFRLLVRGEKKAARWLRQVTALSIRRAN